MEKTNVVSLRPDTEPQTDRERDFIDFMVQKLKSYREQGVVVDSLMMCFVGTAIGKTEDEPDDGDWFSITRFIGDERNVGATLAFMALLTQKYVTDSYCFDE